MGGRFCGNVGQKNMSVIELSQNLEMGEYGIWTNSNEASISYPKDSHLQCFQLEDGSFWFKHRNDCILSAIKRFAPSGPILDIGGGNGYVTRRILDEGFEGALLEPGRTGALNAKIQRHIPEVICSTFENSRFFPDSLRAVGLFDVLEHIEDDRGFLEHIHMTLQANGLLYATVPAHQWLWSPSDVTAQHFRRYDQSMIRHLLGGKFDLLFFTYFFSALTLPVLLFRVLPFRLGLWKKRNVLSSESEHGTGGGPAVGILSTLLAKEVVKIGCGKQIPMGTSCLFVARKIAAQQ